MWWGLRSCVTPESQLHSPGRRSDGSSMERRSTHAMGTRRLEGLPVPTLNREGSLLRGLGRGDCHSQLCPWTARAIGHQCGHQWGFAVTCGPTGPQGKEAILLIVIQEVHMGVTQSPGASPAGSSEGPACRLACLFFSLTAQSKPCQGESEG